MKKLLILIFLAISLYPLSGAPPQDREVQEETIRQLRNDDSFDYTITYKTSDNPFARIWNWIIYKLLQLIGYGAGNPLIRVLFYVFLAAVIIYAVIKIFNININNSFYGSRRSQNPMGEVHEDISQIDFESRISEAFRNGNYREVIRLYYLKSLHILDERNIIKWEKGKTNLDYLFEIKDEGMKSHLSDLNYYFEYAIYGDFPISEGLANDSKRLYTSIHSGIK